MTAQHDSTPPAYPSITAAVRAITPYRVVVMMAAPARRMELSAGIAWHGSWPQHRLAAVLASYTTWWAVAGRAVRAAASPSIHSMTVSELYTTMDVARSLKRVRLQRPGW